MSDIQEFDKILSKIPQTSPLFLFPLRLETHFSPSNPGKKKQLRVRIIPDEALLKYKKESLTSDEKEDGTFFWFQWYIASGDEEREYEAWENLCSKYPVHRAAWICRTLRPKDIVNYRKGGVQFGNRPYVGMEEIEKKCSAIYETLEKISFNELDDVKKTENTKSNFEIQINENLESIQGNIGDITTYIKKRKFIVDYLCDTVYNMAVYLNQRLDYYEIIYQKHPDLKSTNSLQLWDADYSLLNAVKEDVKDLINKLIDKKKSLSDVINQCRKDNPNFFPNCQVDDNPNSNFNFPTAELFPNQFLFIGETKTDKKIIYKLSKYKVKKDCISTFFDLQKDTLNQEATELEFDEKAKWLVDYKAAEDMGMAITIDLDDSVKGFNFIYVLGIKEEYSSDTFEKLFNGHNYNTSSLQFIPARTKTNIVEKDSCASESLSEEDLMRKRYEIEVNDYYINEKRNDANVISELFAGENIYNNCFGHIANFDLKQDHETGQAYSLLWTVLNESEIIASFNKDIYSFLKHFIKNNLRACGKFPSIRIDNLPYGILPVSDFQRICNDFYKNRKIIFKTRTFAEAGFLLNDLVALANKWKDLRNKEQISAPFKGNNAEKDYLKMAGQTPYSISFSERKLIHSPLLEENTPDKLNSTTSQFSQKIFGQSSIFNELISRKLFSAEPIKEAVNEYLDESGNSEIFEKNEITKKLIRALTTGENKFTDDIEVAKKYVGEFLDLFTYRIDAWFSGILDYIRTENRLTPSFLGAYGWVFDLNEGNSKSDSDHFILAPSLQHALSAAVLRSAYTKSIKDKQDSHICVNLSSMRVRQALRLIDGIKIGMSMSVVLGCDLERYLHDASNLYNIELDRCIIPLREEFPQINNIDSQTDEAHSYIMQVINGEALLDTIINHKNWKWEQTTSKWLETNEGSINWIRGLDLKDEKEKSAFFKIIERLMDSYDALNDLLLSEGVHRLVMGDKESFAAIGNFIATGEGGVPEPELLKFPSEKVVVAHKAGLILPQSKSEISSKPLCMADPAIDGWIDSILGDTANIYFTINGGACTLADLNISAAEYLYLSANPQAFNKYLEICWRIKNNKFNSEPIEFTESPIDLEAQDMGTRLSLEEDALRIETLRKIIKAGRSLKPSDLLNPDENNITDEDYIDSNDLEKRFNTIAQKAKDLHKELKKWLDENKSAAQLDENAIRRAYELLCNCYELGMVNSLIEYKTDIFNSEESKALLHQYVEDAMNDLDINSKSKNRILSAIEQFESKDYVSAIQTLTLKNAKVFPLFKLPPNNLGIDNDIADDFSKIQNTDKDSFEKWEDEIAEVRSGMKEIHNLSMFQTALEKDVGKISILQNTKKTDDESKKWYWMGAAVKDEKYLTDADSLILYNTGSYECGNNYNSGFIFDSWIEYIPYKKHNAGLVFHCDKPDNEAPQALLYAMYPSVVPSSQETWNFDSLKEILDTTRFMMMNRAVEPDMIYKDMELSRIFPLIKQK